MTEITRDRWGRPMVVPPGGDKPVAYTRVTTLAKTLEDEGSLAKWKMRMTALGLVHRPDLYARVATAGEDKGALDRLCDEAFEAAGGSARANLGTALHAATEHIDRGNEPGPMLAQFAADLDAYRTATADLDVLPDHIERFVVLDDWKVAGTFDRIYRHDGRLVIGDLKTGADLRYSWRSIAVQLAVYAHGTFYDVDTNQRSPLPDIDPDVGLVVHLPAGEGRCDLYEVDLVAGWEAAELSMWTREWRKANIARPVSLPAGRRGAAPAGTATVEPSPPVAPVAQGEAGPRQPASPADRQALRDRARWLADNAPGFLDALQLRWPAGIPGLATDHAHTDDELALIARAIDDAAGTVEAPFGPPPEPEPNPFAGINGEATTATKPERTAPRADAARCEAAIAALQALPSDLLADVEAACLAKGVPNLRSGTATVEHLGVVEVRTYDAQKTAEKRQQRVAELLDGFEPDEAATLVAWATRDQRPLEQMTGTDVANLDALVGAIGAGINLDFATPDRSGTISVNTDVMGQLLVARHGTKAKALAAGRTLAAELDVPAPRAFDALAGEPVLAARLVLQAS